MNCLNQLWAWLAGELSWCGRAQHTVGSIIPKVSGSGPYKKASQMWAREQAKQAKKQHLPWFLLPGSCLELQPWVLSMTDPEVSDEISPFLPLNCFGFKYLVRTTERKLSFKCCGCWWWCWLRPWALEEPKRQAPAPHWEGKWTSFEWRSLVPEGLVPTLVLTRETSSFWSRNWVNASGHEWIFPLYCQLTQCHTYS